jgi:ABC-type nitrate/sulfonate/bicarbonate transport system ATPase subunit
MALKVQNISFGYSSNTQILDNISFEVSHGKVFCVLGASGSGKSTLLRIIADLLPDNKSSYFSGKVQFNNQNINKLKLTGKLAFMFQEPTLMNNLTVEENIEFPFRLLNKMPQTSVEDTIKIVGLTDSTKKYPKELSGGMKTRTALARSFITQPKLLLLDEPFSALDLGWRNTLYGELKTLQKRDNTTIIIVTHDIDEALEISDKVLILSHNGSMLQTYDVTATNKSEIAEEAKKIVIDDHQISVTV